MLAEDSRKTFAKSFDSLAILSSRNDPLGKARLINHSSFRVNLPRTLCGRVRVVNMGKLIFHKSSPFDTMFLKIEPSFISAVFGRLMRNYKQNLQSSSPN